MVCPAWPLQHDRMRRAQTCQCGGLGRGPQGAVQPHQAQWSKFEILFKVAGDGLHQIGGG
jgi:hypothetical protein